MSEKDQEAPRIMIVDDAPQNLQLLETMLLARGYQVFALPNGEMALKAAARKRPEMILLDILMPGIDGYEVCRRLKADPNLQDIPVLFLSALNEPWDKVRAFHVGGVDYITKPFQIDEIEARVRTHLELRRQKRELQANYERLRELEELREALGDPENETTDKIYSVENRIAEIDTELAEIGDIEKAKEKMVEDARERVREEIIDEWENGLKDPVSFLVEEHGMYSMEDLMKANFIVIDYDAAAQDAIGSDGWAHYLSMYDGNYDEIDDGYIIFREQ